MKSRGCFATWMRAIEIYFRKPDLRYFPRSRKTLCSFRQEQLGVAIAAGFSTLDYCR
jgi:hypothetical protein